MIESPDLKTRTTAHTPVLSVHTTTSYMISPGEWTNGHEF
jgi:hypothetical protein